MILIRKHNIIVVLWIDNKQAKSIKNKSLIKKCGEKWSNVGENVYL